MDPTMTIRIHNNVRRDLQLADKCVAPEAPEAHGPSNGAQSSEIWNAVEPIRRSRALSGCHRLRPRPTAGVSFTRTVQPTPPQLTPTPVTSLSRAPAIQSQITSIL